MHEAVDDIIQRRKVEPGGLRRVVSTSLAIHVGMVLVLFLMPKSWYLQAQPNVELMTISLSGTLGERSGGMVSAGARPVERVEPPPKRPEPIPPATPPKPDVMSIPTKTQPKAAATPTPTPDPGPPSQTTRPPTTGAQLSRGTSVAETGSTSQSTGQSTGGGLGGAQLETEVPFCCPDYLEEVARRIRMNWVASQPETGSVQVAFEIRRDGSFSKPIVLKETSVMLRVASLSAFEKLVLPRLPEQFKEDRLRIRLTFPYVR
jgi:hypothetical protein